MQPAVALLSAGLDSTASILTWMRDGAQVTEALCVNYGQRAARAEMRAATAICERLGVALRCLELPLAQLGVGSGLHGEGTIPRDVDLDDSEATRASASAVWVPNRNGLLIALAAARAEQIGAQVVLTGFNREEAATFADNSAEFITAQNAALAYSTRNGVRVEAPTIAMRKAQIAAVVLQAQFPPELLWSCYHSGRVPCGHCESCRRFARGFEEAGYALPHTYYHPE